MTLGAVKFWLRIQQENRFQTAVDHLLGIQTRCSWHGTYKLRTHRIGSFSKVTHRGTGMFRNPIRHRQQRSSVGMVGCRIT